MSTAPDLTNLPADTYFDEEKNVVFIPARNKKKEIVKWTRVSPESVEFLRNKTFRFQKYIILGFQAEIYCMPKLSRFLIEKHNNITIPRDRVVDHIDRDVLNNTLTNLRLATKSENAQNRTKKQGAVSKYLGVSKAPTHKKFCAYSHLNGKSYNIGYFENELWAAYAYDQFILEHFPHGQINGVPKPDGFVMRVKQEKASQLPTGVFHYKNTNSAFKYRSYFQNQYLGKFKTVDEAKMVYDQTTLAYEAKINKEILELPITRNADNVAFISSTHDIPILVDDEKWHQIKRMGSPSHKLSKEQGSSYPVVKHEGKPHCLHRLLAGLQPNDPRTVDHINGNIFDCRLSNLRIATSPSQQAHNRRKRKNTKSTHIGVYEEKSKKFKATICHNGKLEYLGLFNTLEEAARARDQKAVEYFGEFARLNFSRNDDATNAHIETHMDTTIEG